MFFFRKEPDSLVNSHGTEARPRFGSGLTAAGDVERCAAGCEVFPETISIEGGSVTPEAAEGSALAPPGRDQDRDELARVKSWLKCLGLLVALLLVAVVALALKVDFMPQIAATGDTANQTLKTGIMPQGPANQTWPESFDRDQGIRATEELLEQVAQRVRETLDEEGSSRQPPQTPGLDGAFASLPMLPGLDGYLGAFVDHLTQDIGRRAVVHTYEGQRTFTNPLDTSIEYKVSDCTDRVTHFAESSAKAAVDRLDSMSSFQSFQSRSRGFSVGFGDLVRVGHKRQNQKMENLFAFEGSLAYSVEKTAGAFQCILKADVAEWLEPQVKDSLDGLPRPYDKNDDGVKQAYKHFFDTHGSFFIDQVWLGGKIEGSVYLSNGVDLESTYSTSAVQSGIQANLGEWAGGLGSGGSGGSGALLASIRESSVSDILVMGGDHADPVAYTSLGWGEEELHGWYESVRESPVPINFKVRDASALASDPGLKQALQDAIVDMYGVAALELRQFVSQLKSVEERAKDAEDSIDKIRAEVENTRAGIPTGSRGLVYSCSWISVKPPAPLWENRHDDGSPNVRPLPSLGSKSGCSGVIQDVRGFKGEYWKSRRSLWERVYEGRSGWQNKWGFYDIWAPDRNHGFEVYCCTAQIDI